MRLTRRVSLGGVYLDEIDDSIVIRGVDPGTPEESISTVPRMGGAGSRITAQHYNQLDATVNFAIMVPKRNLKKRSEIYRAVIAWAMQKGYLKFNTMPNMRMLVEKVIVSSPGDLYEWEKDFTITFRAVSIPFWIDSSNTTVTRSTITNGSVSVEIGGDVETYCNITCKNKSGKVINNLSVDTGLSKMTFTGLELAGSEELVIDHSYGILRIRIKNTAGKYRSAMGKRSGADDLWIKPGVNTITISSDRAVQLTVETYGRYL